MVTSKMLNLTRNVYVGYSDNGCSYTNYLKELSSHLPVPNELNKFPLSAFYNKKMINL